MNIKEMVEKRIKERRNQRRAKVIMKVTTSTMAGIAAGVVGGVLVAPKSGKETRNDIAKTAKDIGESAVTKTIEFKEILDNKVVETKNNANIAKEKMTKYLSDRKAEKSYSKNEAAIEENEKFESMAKTEE